MLKQINENLLLAYVNYGSKSKLDFKKVFTSLSVEMGGDGKTITKAQLDSYIKKAEKGSIKVGKTRLQALKMIQANWKELSKGRDNITLADLEGAPSLLAMVAVNDYEEDDEDEEKKKKKVNDEKENKTKKVQDYVKELEKKLNKTEINKEDLKTVLKDLISKSSEEEDNSEEIATISNIMADFASLSKGKTSISSKNIASSSDIIA